MKTIWVVGSLGNVGSAIIRQLNCLEYEIIETDKDEVDITDEGQVSKYMNMSRPDVVINCAGYSDVQKCEENIDEAYKVNALGVRNLAQAAESIQAKLIQISTDDVFSVPSDRPYNEFDSVNPGNIYGKSKFAGELMVEKLMTRYAIIRSSWLYGIKGNFLDKVIENIGSGKPMEVADNDFAVPTSAKEIAKVIAQFIDNDHCGLYHAVCTGGPCSRYEYAKEILKILGKENELELIPVNEKQGVPKKYSALDNMMLRISGMEEPIEWKAALKEYLLSK